MSYYESQLSKLKTSDEYAMTIQINDAYGNKTNYLSLNNESIDVIVAYLNSLKLPETQPQ